MGIDTAGRRTVLDQALSTRAGLVAAYDAAPPLMWTTPLPDLQQQRWISARSEAKLLIARFHDTVGALRRDRLARRVANAWLEAAIIRWWDRGNAAADVEAAAWSYLEQLVEQRCPRRAPSELERGLDSALARLEHDCVGDLATMSRMSREVKKRQR